MVEMQFPHCNSHNDSRSYQEYVCLVYSNMPSIFRTSVSDKCKYALDLAPITVRTFVKVNGDEFDLVSTSFPLCY